MNFVGKCKFPIERAQMDRITCLEYAQHNQHRQQNDTKEVSKQIFNSFPKKLSTKRLVI